MKTYSIGRDLNCDIVINDSTDVISRRHALLNVAPSGKMTIIDQSSNGTYVNGIRISQNVPVPVTRKDVVSLAHVAKLDWSQVPKSNQWVKYLIGIFIAAAIAVGTIFGIKHFKSDDGNGPGTTTPTEQNDSTLIKQHEKARVDSIRNIERLDSIKKAEDKQRKDSIEAAKKVTGGGKKTTPRKPNDDDKKTTPDNKAKDDKQGQNKKRTIG